MPTEWLSTLDLPESVRTEPLLPRNPAFDLTLEKMKSIWFAAAQDGVLHTTIRKRDNGA